MPTLAECQSASDDMVSQLLCYMPISQYYGIDMKQVASFLDRNARRRYLYTLILVNDREKADFETIKEEALFLEQSLGNPIQRQGSLVTLERLKSLRKWLKAHENVIQSNFNKDLAPGISNSFKLQNGKNSKMQEKEVELQKSCPPQMEGNHQRAINIRNHWDMMSSSQKKVSQPPKMITNAIKKSILRI